MPRITIDVEADEVSEERWWAGQSRAAICRWCPHYKPAST
jgi:hypothetical protein